MLDPNVQDTNGNFQSDIARLREGGYRINRYTLNGIFNYVDSVPLNAYIASIDEESRRRDLLALHKSALNNMFPYAFLHCLLAAAVTVTMFMFVLGIIKFGSCQEYSSLSPDALFGSPCGGTFMRMRASTFFLTCIFILVWIGLFYMCAFVVSPMMRHHGCYMAGINPSCRFQRTQKLDHHLLCALVPPPL